MQGLNILSLTDYKLEVLASKIPEMKHVFISSINSTLTKLRSFTPNFWFPMKVKLVLAMGTPTTSCCTGNVFLMVTVMYVNTLDELPYQLIIPTLN